eukprot:7524681-Pyramimonas_sp.AAC.1
MLPMGLQGVMRLAGFTGLMEFVGEAHSAYKGPGAPWSYQLLGAIGLIELAMLLGAIGPITLTERVGLVGLMAPIGVKGQVGAIGLIGPIGRI